MVTTSDPAETIRVCPLVTLLERHHKSGIINPSGSTGETLLQGCDKTRLLEQSRRPVLVVPAASAWLVVPRVSERYVGLIISCEGGSCLQVELCPGMRLVNLGA